MHAIYRHSIHTGFVSTLIFALTAAPLFSVAEEKIPNYIFMIGDDMAVETLDCYGLGSETASTPNLNELCNMGVRFDNFWAQPVCSATRASLLTGQYAFKNGVGSPVLGMKNVDWNIPKLDEASGVENTNNNQYQNTVGGQARINQDKKQNTVANTDSIPRPGLKSDAYTFINALDLAGYQTAAIGKWHLADDDNGGWSHPLKSGFDHYSGSMRSGGVTSFYGWSKTIDAGEPFGQIGYATTDMIDDGIAWLNQINEIDPFFLWVAFNAPHTPIHMPPKELLSSSAKNLDPNAVNSDEHAYFNAMIEAMDTEIGRLLNNLDEDTRNNTYVIFMGDNGTSNQVVKPPFERNKAKGTVYQGGIQVPFMIAGPGIKAGQTSPSLAHAVDIFDTVLELSNTIPEKDTATHSVSLKPILLEDPQVHIRDYVFSDQFGVAGGTAVDHRAIRDSEYKLIENRLTNIDLLFHLRSDPYEKNNLLNAELSSEQKQHYDNLKKQIIQLTSE